MITSASAASQTNCPDPFIALAKVVTPAMLTLSKFVWPSTSKSPFASIAPVKVETPAILTLSKFVWPSTSISLGKFIPVEVVSNL